MLRINGAGFNLAILAGGGGAALASWPGWDDALVWDDALTWTD